MAASGRARSTGGARAALTAALWATLIFALSTETFSRANTDALVARWSAALDVSASEARIDGMVSVVRDAAHLVEFFVLSWLLHRALAARLRLPPLAVALVTALAATGYGLLDEVHQRFVHGRSASAADLVKDAAGAALAGIWVFASRKPAPSAESIPSRRNSRS